MRKKHCIAMLLAGGQGSRLGILTKSMAKPAVPFGGKYRIIDFPLSNCANSGIDVVGVLTQYQPLELNAYIGSGGPWDLDLTNGGVFVLPPYVKGKSGEWYRGTANAIYQNMGFIQQYDPDYVLILSGDHIYRMNYNAMVNYHIEKGADVTIAELEVPWRRRTASASSTQTTTTKSSSLTKTRARKVQQGVDGRVCVHLEKAARLPHRRRGRSQILQRLWQKRPAGHAGRRAEALRLSLQRLLEGRRHGGQPAGGQPGPAGGPCPIDLADKRWRIYSRNPVLPPEYTAPGAVVKNALITEGCQVSGNVQHSVLFAGVTVEQGATVQDAVVMPRVNIGRGSAVRRAIIAENAVIGPGCVIGGEEGGIAVVAQGANLPAGTVVLPGEQYDKKA